MTYEEFLNIPGGVFKDLKTILILKDKYHTKILIHTFKELINQLQQSPGVIMCADVLELCEELEAL